MNRVLFIGSKELGFSAFTEIYNISPEKIVGCVTVDDSLDTRSFFNEFKLFSTNNEIPFYVVNKSSQLNDIIDELKPDICFVLGWYFLISKNVLESVPNGFIGIHNSLLPKYRGFAPLVWTMINGDRQVGFSLFSFEEGMDTGDIWATGIVDVDEQDFVEDVIKKVDKEIVECIKNVYPRILSQSITPKKQSSDGITYCGKRLPDDGKINWYKNNLEVYNFIRAQSHPYPGAYTLIDGEKVIIWKCKRFDYPIYGTPGQVGLILDDDIVVVCGDNTGLVITDYECNNETSLKKLKSLNCRF
ncbi:MAG: methionyl-tRNA formyltransferase [Clostridia bacterium]|nr:methionyl-tRNA formyltransferase [Clostridia bacterium]